MCHHVFHSPCAEFMCFQRMRKTQPHELHTVLGAFKFGHSLKICGFFFFLWKVLNEHLLWFYMWKDVYGIKFLSNLLLSAAEKISRGSQSWPSIHWETESSMHSFLRGELSLLFMNCFFGNLSYLQEFALHVWVTPTTNLNKDITVATLVASWLLGDSIFVNLNSCILCIFESCLVVQSFWKLKTRSFPMHQ